MLENLETLARSLAEAHRDPARKLVGAAFAALDFDQAQELQALTRRLLGETCPVSKVAIDASGRAVAAPIYGSLTGPSGTTLDLPQRGWLGLEVEIAIRLSRAVTPAMAESGVDAVRDAIESFHVGVEIVGSRFDDRLTAGPNGPFADNMNSAGYVWSPLPWTRGVEVNGLPITVTLDGETLWEGPSKLPFGDLLAPVLAYARSPLAFDALAAGKLVTTGTLCGLVALNQPGRVAARIADAAPVEFTVRRAA